MDLQTFKTTKDLSDAQIAAGIGVSVATANRYAHKKRIPGPQIMERIFIFTGGKVTPNDFFGISEKPNKNKKS